MSDDLARRDDWYAALVRDGKADPKPVTPCLLMPLRTETEARAELAAKTITSTNNEISQPRSIL